MVTEYSLHLFILKALIGWQTVTKGRRASSDVLHFTCTGLENGLTLKKKSTFLFFALHSKEQLNV